MFQRRQLSSLSIWFYLVGVFIASVWFMIIWEYRKMADVQSIIKGEHKSSAQIQSPPQLSQPVTSSHVGDSQEPPSLSESIIRDDQAETISQGSKVVQEDSSERTEEDSTVLLPEAERGNERDSQQSQVGKSGVAEKTDAADSTNSVPECGRGEFFWPKNYSELRCYVAEPEGYQLPYNRAERLWNVPRKNLGWLNTSEHDYHNQVHNQRWITFDKKTAHLKENGGTSMRAFGTNFDYFDIFVNTTQIYSRCRNVSRPVVLDTGAGVGGLGATAIDGRAGNRTISVMSYVPVDNYLRLATIISDRGLPVFLNWYSGAKLPVPSESFDVVHCRWCWHHLVGYDTWLNEMNRIIVPGGAFVFTFVPVQDQELLPLDKWYEALAKMPWECNRYARIVQVCIKKKEPTQAALPCSYRREELESGSATPEIVVSQVNRARSVLLDPEHTWNADLNDRVLNLNCETYQTCVLLEATWNKPTTMNTFNRTDGGTAELRRMLQGGSIGLLHDWNKPGPFYPRFFDVINLLGGKDTHFSNDIIFESHRLLRPGGFLIVMDSTCEEFAQVAQLLSHQPLFKVVSNIDGVLVAKKTPISSLI